MPRDASGNYTLPTGNPVVTETLITSVWANTTMSDLGSEMTDSLSRSGKGAMQAPLRAIDKDGTTPGLAFRDELTSGLLRESSGDIRLHVLGQAASYFGTDRLNGAYVAKVDKDTSLAALVAKIGSSATTVWLYPETWAVPTSLTVPKNIHLIIPNGVDFSLTAGQQLTVEGTFDAGLYQVVSGDGTLVVQGNNMSVYPQWWGAVGDNVADDTVPVQKSINAAAAGRKELLLPRGIYRITGANGLLIGATHFIMRGEGISNSLFSYSEAGTCLRLTDNVTARNSITLRDFGFTQTGVNQNLAIDGRLARNVVFENIQVTDFDKGWRMRESWNCIFLNCRTINVYTYGIHCELTCDYSSFINVSIDGRDQAGSNGLIFENSNAITVSGVCEDFEWGIKSVSSQIDITHFYAESCILGALYFTGPGTQGLIDIGILYTANNPGPLIKGDVQGGVRVRQLRDQSSSTIPAKVFELTSNAYATWGRITGLNASTVLGTCESSSGGRIMPMDAIQAQQYFSELVTLTASTTDTRTVCRTNRSWRLGRVVVRKQSGTLTGSVFKLGTSASDAAFANVTLTNDADQNIHLDASYTQPGGDYVNQLGYLQWKIEAAAGSGGCKVEVHVQYYLARAGGDSLGNFSPLNDYIAANGLDGDLLSHNFFT